MLEVLCRRTKHGRAPDVDHFNGLLLAHVLASRDLRERIEVDADEVEGLDLVLGERLEVLLHVAAGQDGPVDLRMQRLDPSPEQLRDVGELVDGRDRKPEL